MLQKVLGLNCLEQRIWFGRLTAGQNTPHCWKRLVIQRIALLFRGWQPNFQKLLEIFEVVTSKFSIICPLTSMASKTGRPKILKIVSNQCKSSSIFGRFALIWGYFQKFWWSRFWGHWGQRTFNVEEITKKQTSPAVRSVPLSQKLTHLFMKLSFLHCYFMRLRVKQMLRSFRDGNSSA